MQNFTFGRKGLNWFLFAFILFVGSSSSYGQCADVNDEDAGTAGNQQSYCYLSTIQDLLEQGTDDGDPNTAPANIEIYETADSANDTDPIDRDELLTNATTYFFGDSTDSSCARVPVEVSVDAGPTPQNEITGGRDSFTISPCESSGFTAQELENLFTNDPGYELEVYDTEFGENALAPGTTLTPGDSYFVGQVDDGSGSNCPSTRAAVGYDPLQAPGPTADASQTYCEGATIADLMASGTESNTQAIRWYRSQTSNSPLADDVELVNNEDYFAAQVVNDRNSPFPPCETIAGERTRVVVTIIEGPDAGEDNSGEVCESNVQETFPSNDAVRNFYLNLLEEGVPTNGTFNPTIDQIVSQYQNDDDGLGDFTVAYTIGEDDCQDSVELTISVVPAEDAEAGDNFSESYCVDQNENIDLFNFLSDDAIVTGDFSAPFEDGVFNPSEEGAGTYTITYSVNESNSCVIGSDEATFTIEVNDVNEENITINIDPSEYEGMNENQILADLSNRFIPFFNGTPDFSAFDPDLGTAFAGLDPQNPEGTYEITYTGNPCEILNFTVIIEEEEVVDPVPGEPTGIVCENDVEETFPSIDEIRKYYLALLPEGTATNGTFDPTPSELADMYQEDLANDDGLGDFSTTYTVNGESFELTVTVIPAVEANAGDFDDILDVCTGDATIDLTTLINNNQDAQAGGTFSGTGVSGNIFDPSTGQGSYTITYTVDDSSGCIIEGDTDSTDFTINVVEGDANAGENGTANLNENDDPVNLFDYLNGDPDTGGTWSPGNPDGSFDPATDPEGDYMYTVTDGDCSDSATVSVIIESDTDCTGNEAGADNFGIVCLADVDITFPSVDETRKYILALRDSGVPSNGTFNPTITQLIDTYNDDADGLGDFTTTYTVTVNGCTDSTELTVRVVEEGPANAGSFEDIPEVCSDEDPINLDTLSNNDSEATIGGTFTGTGVTNNVFDPSVGAGTYTITYSVDDSTPCTTGNDSTTFTIEVNDAPVSTSISRTLCITDARDLISDSSAGFAFLENLVEEAGVEDFDAANFGAGVLAEATRLSNFIETPTSDSETFSFEYTDPSDSVCDDGTINIEITINDLRDAEAGDIDDQTVCASSGMIDLTTFFTDETVPGGTFSGMGVEDNMFDSSIGANEDGYEITYSVDDSADCVTTGTSDSTTFTIEVNDAPVSTSISRTLCVTDARDLISDSSAGFAFLENLVEEAGVEDFDAANFGAGVLAEATRLSSFIETPTSDSETFSFEYTDPSDSVCDDGTINIEITINDLRDAEAGDIDDQTVCASSGMIDLTTFFTDETVPGGTFSGMGVEDNMFDSSIGANEDGYEITYSVDDSADCVTTGTSDSTTFTIFIDNSVDAGSSNSTDVCRDDISNIFPSNGAVRNFYLNLLDEGVSRNGTFEPTIQQLIDDFNAEEDQDEYTTTYTITNGTCSASVDLTINVFDALPAEIGDIENPDPICRNAEDVDLFSFLPADANPNGTFEGYEDGIFSPVMAGVGSFEVTYTLTEDSPCTEGEASATFTITVTESAFAGMDMDLSVCMNDDVQNLFDFISVDADDNGEFTLDGEVIADGMMNPADFEAGEYEVIYTVAAINDCGDDTAEFTITVQEAPDAPTVEGDPFTFCATDGATAADLSATGTNLTYYSDEALSMMVAPEDVLVDGTYYVTQRNDDGACESAATEFTVTINDAATPTISNTTQEFCEFDDATIADLTELINETGTITWYDSADGDNALDSGTSLQDGVTYYATLFNVDTGCESSVRLGVTVSINDDCPLTIPEGFSPNGDGLNDRFEIENIRDKYPNFTIEIRNRFGDVVYKGNANTPDWDGFSTEGSFGSDVLPVGAYFYYLRYNDGSTEPVRGTVYLSR